MFYVRRASDSLYLQEDGSMGLKHLNPLIFNCREGAEEARNNLNRIQLLTTHIYYVAEEN